MKIIYLILAISILINLLVLVVDAIPFLWPKIKRKIFKDKQSSQTIDYEELEASLIKRSVEMINSDKVAMVWSDHQGFTERSFNFIRYGTQSKFKTYNYPRAYLYYGLSEYYKNKKDIEGQTKLKNTFDKLLNDKGQPTFTLDKVDQAPFGLVALNLYSIYNKEKYKLFYEYIYQFLLDHRNKDGLILYRKGSTNQLNDILGMIIPFLVQYYKTTADSNALQIARTQLDFYIEHGVDKETYIPAHGIDMRSSIKTGSINWGRGIGWYLIGLSALHSVTGKYDLELDRIYESLNKTRTTDNLFGQFPGSLNLFDASTSTMFLYSFSFLEDDKMTKKDILNLFSPYIDKEGRVVSTSGDTYGLNSYSESFGYSDLSQGILLLLLSRTEK